MIYHWYIAISRLVFPFGIYLDTSYHNGKQAGPILVTPSQKPVLRNMTYFFALLSTIAFNKNITSNRTPFAQTRTSGFWKKKRKSQNSVLVKYLKILSLFNSGIQENIPGLNTCISSLNMDLPPPHLQGAKVKYDSQLSPGILCLFPGSIWDIPTPTLALESYLFTLSLWNFQTIFQNNYWDPPLPRFKVEKND